MPNRVYLSVILLILCKQIVGGGGGGGVNYFLFRTKCPFQFINTPPPPPPTHYHHNHPSKLSNFHCYFNPRPQFINTPSPQNQLIIYFNQVHHPHVIKEDLLNDKNRKLLTMSTREIYQENLLKTKVNTTI